MVGFGSLPAVWGGGGVFAITDFSDLLIFFVHWTVRAESVESPALQLTVVPYSDHNLFFYPEKVKKTGEKKRTVSSAKKKPAGEKEKAKGKLTPEKKTPPAAKSRGERRAERNEFGAPVGWRDLDSVRTNGPLLKQRAKNEPQVGFFLLQTAGYPVWSDTGTVLFYNFFQQPKNILGEKVPSSFFYLLNHLCFTIMNNLILGFYYNI